MGELGYTEHEYLCTTLGSLLLAYDRYQDKRKADDLEDWRRTRWIGFVQVRLHGDSKGPGYPQRPEDLIRLEGDEAGPSSILDSSPDEQRKFFADLREQGWKV